jgi:hypothetical protein
VEPHIGKRYPAGAAGVIQVVHGYCIAAGAIAGGSAAIGHVVETGAPAAAAASGGAGNGDPDGPTRASPAIVLRNYAAAISLSGGPTTGELLKDFAASGRFPRIWNEEFREIEFRGQPFMIGASPRANGGFALWRPIFDQLFFLLQGRLSLESDLVWQLPDQQLLRQNEDGGAVLPDGLAVLPPGYLDRQGMIFPLESNAAAAFDYANRMPMR